ncbi:MAG: hypothetical protein LW688_05285 [Cryomorphaceae bacterium]|jgi:hypothetical protein|nr:hypothetical protein [Cryomorphaceae bacterium]
MKNIFSAVLFFCSISLFGQSTNQSTPKKSNPLPNSLFNLDVNYALGSPILGIKSVIGSNNSGFLLGFQFGGYEFSPIDYYSEIEAARVEGYNETYNFKSLRIGYQGSIFNGLYWNTSIDLCSSSYYNYSSYDYDAGYYQSYSDYGDRRGYRVNLGIGYTLSLLKSKRLYLNSEFVVHVLDRSQFNTTRIQASFGIGYRIGTPAKTTYEGVKEIRTVPMQP